MTEVVLVDENGDQYTSGPYGVKYYIGCSYCDSEKERNSSFFPSHKANPGCESGKHTHCTCDSCF